MGIRETLNENPRLTTGVTAGIIAIVLIYILWSALSGGGADASGGGASGQVFFTDDDGKTWFADDQKKVPPFDHGGKEAVRAYVFKCGPDGKPFVNHMERYSKESKKKLEEVLAKGNAINDPTVFESIQTAGLEFKSPGQKDWIKVSDPKHTAVLQPKCPKPEDVEQVLP